MLDAALILALYVFLVLAIPALRGTLGILIDALDLCERLCSLTKGRRSRQLPMRTCVRVSIKGSPYGNFRRALATGNLTVVRAAAAELPSINLATR